MAVHLMILMADHVVFLVVSLKAVHLRVPDGLGSCPCTASDDCKCGVSGGVPALHIVPW